jgi:hypothetical protein
MPRQLIGRGAVLRAAIASGALAGALAASPTAAANTPLPIQNIAYSGNGCPQGSVGQSISSDRISFTLIFDSYVASSGPSVPATENSKACRVDILLSLPHGWHFTGATFVRRGYVQLPTGVTGRAELASTVNGHARRADAAVSFVGPVAQDYLATTSLKATRGLGRCNGATQTLSLLGSLRLGGSTGMQAQITNDSIDGKVTIAACSD